MWAAYGGSKEVVEILIYQKKANPDFVIKEVYYYYYY